MRRIIATVDAMASRGRVFEKIFLWKSKYGLLFSSLGLGILLLLGGVHWNEYRVACLILLAMISLAQTYERFRAQERQVHAQTVHQLQIEKNYADLVAAQISDGIWLIDGFQVLYANPVGIQILESGWYGIKRHESGLNQRSLCVFAEGGLPGEKPLPISAGAEAILQAMNQSLPLEFTLNEGEKKRHFVLQANILPQCPKEGWINPPQRTAPDGDECESCVQNCVMNDSQSEPILVVAQDVTLAKESQEAKGHFLGILSHEIKTPVTSITMAIHLLNRMAKAPSASTVPLETVSSLITTCVEEVDRLRKLLDDFMKLSHMDALGNVLQNKRVDFIKLVKHAVQSFYGISSERGVSLRFQLLTDHKVLWMWVDPAKITWALSNLLTQSIRHTSQGGVVDLLVETTDQSVKVTVRDTGSPIASTWRGQIFEKFSGHYDIRNSRAGSADSGLAIAREIIVSHGGQISVSSPSEICSEFSFVLPFVKEMGSLTSPRDTSSKGDNSGTSAGSR